MCNKAERPDSTSRRKFIKTVSGAAASALVLGASTPVRGKGKQPTIYCPRPGKANPYVTSDGKPILVSVRGTDFSKMLNAGLRAMGGLKRLVDKDQDVLINPNFNHSEPYPGISSVSSVVSVLEAVKQVTQGTVSIGDEGYQPTADVYKYLGLEPAVSKAGGRVVNFSGSYSVRRDSWSSRRPDIKVFRQVYDAPVLISTCLIKRHHTASLTCGLKNNVGAIEGSGATSSRSYLHRRSDFMQEVAEIARAVNPDLVIIDARSILTQNGPYLSSGGTVVNTGRVIICGDLVAADAYCAQIMEKCDPSFSASKIETTLHKADELGIGTCNLKKVKMIEVAA
ncbi:MAG: DUF362 domain-containing protein [bacterium]|nr:DUF362 domain-containing protein [bacterium]